MNSYLTPTLTLPLSFNHTESSLRQYFEERLGSPVTLVLTGNSTSMLSVRVLDGILRVRLHRMFTDADSRVIDEIVFFLKNRKGPMACFRRFVRDRSEHLPKRPPNKMPVNTLGKCYDLRDIYHDINDEYFGGTINAVITWGTSSPRYAVRKRTLGSYSERSRMIRINPALDRKTVPRYVIAFVVYHEMLHAVIGISRRGGRRIVHPPEFKRRERLFKDYEKAMVWERIR